MHIVTGLQSGHFDKRSLSINAMKLGIEVTIFIHTDDRHFCLMQPSKYVIWPSLGGILAYCRLSICCRTACAIGIGRFTMIKRVTRKD